MTSFVGAQGGPSRSALPPVVWLLPLVLVAAACPERPPQAKVSRVQAIEIARREVSFEPDSVEAVLAESEDRTVWRVTFRGRLPGQPPGLFESVIVEIDTVSGVVVSVVRT